MRIRLEFLGTLVDPELSRCLYAVPADLSTVCELARALASEPFVVCVDVSDPRRFRPACSACRPRGVACTPRAACSLALVSHPLLPGGLTAGGGQATEELRLTVGGFALPPSQPVHGVLRDDDLVQVELAGTPTTQPKRSNPDAARSADEQPKAKRSKRRSSPKPAVASPASASLGSDTAATSAPAAAAPTPAFSATTTESDDDSDTEDDSRSVRRRL